MAFHLHDDFYDDDGTAYQPDKPVINNNDYKIPIIEDVKNDINMLIDYYLSKWFINDEIIKEFSKFKSEDILNNVKKKYNNSRNFENRDKLIDLCSKALKEDSADFIREIWIKEHENHRYTLSKACAICLPFNEAYSLLTNELKKVDKINFPQYSYQCLCYFQSHEIIKYIEEHVEEFNNSWGNLAAFSKITWHDIKLWIDKGRPFSLIALQALVWLIPGPGAAPLVNKLKPKLLNPVSVSEMTNDLELYKEKDNVPRVHNQIDKIINNWDKIL